MQLLKDGRVGFVDPSSPGWDELFDPDNLAAAVISLNQCLRNMPARE